MKWTSTQPILGVGNACFEPQVIPWEGPSIVNLETNAGLIIQAEAAYYITTRVALQKKIHIRDDTCLS